MRIRQFDSLRALAAVYKHRSFTRAAKALNVSISSLSRWVAALEESLGTRLIHRDTRKLSFTGSGELYASNVARLLGALEETETFLAEASIKPHGTLRIASPTNFVKSILVRVISSYRALYPDVIVELSLEDEECDLVEKGYDLGVISLSSIRHSTLVTRPLVRDEAILCAAPSYLAKRGCPGNPDELKRHDLLSAPTGDFDLSSVVFQHGEERVELRSVPSFFAADIDILRDAALNGMGIGVFPVREVRKQLHEGHLVRLMHDYALPSIGYQIAYPSRTFLPSKVRTFIDHLVSNLESNLPAY